MQMEWAARRQLIGDHIHLSEPLRLVSMHNRQKSKKAANHHTTLSSDSYPQLLVYCVQGIGASIVHVCRVTLNFNGAYSQTLMHCALYIDY